MLRTPEAGSLEPYGTALGAAVGGIGMLLALLLSGVPAAPVAAQTRVDLELVLAVDASGSVDSAEYELQMQGIASALRDPEVAAAIASGPSGSIAVTVMLWAEANRPKQSLPWAKLSDAGSIERFAAEVARMPRRLPAGGTGIGKAIQYAVWEIDRNDYIGTRQVIDVSGDGRETAFPGVQPVRAPGPKRRGAEGDDRQRTGDPERGARPLSLLRGRGDRRCRCLRRSGQEL